MNKCELYLNDDIKELSYKGNKDIRRVIIGKNVKNIGAEAFSMCPNIESIEVDKENQWFTSADHNNCIISKKTKVLLFGCFKTIIPDFVEEIGPFAFCGQTKLETVDIPGNVRIISANAFNGCENLKSVSMADGVKEIHEFGFKNCNELESVSFPKTLTRVDESAFGMTFCLDDECYGMLIDEGCVKVNNISFDGPKEDFYRVTNFQNIFVMDCNLSYSDMHIKCSDGDIVFSNTNIDF